MTPRGNAPIRITDRDDPRVAPYLDIRERDLVGRRGLFVAEGRVVVNQLLDSPEFELCSILVLKNRLAGIASIVERAGATPVYVAEAAVMDMIAGFPMHRGILAIGRRNTATTAAQLLGRLPGPARILVLVGIANHDNIGAIFRNAAAFGVAAVLLDPTCCDPLYRKAIRVSVGAVFRTPFASFSDIDGLVADLAVADVEMIALSPKGAVDLRVLKSAQRCALFLGTEGDGLPEALLSRLQTVRITMAADFDSLNVATAAAIALHHLATGDPSVG